MKKDNKIEKRLFTLHDACKYLSCSLDLVEDLIAMGEIPIIRFGQPPGKGKKEQRKRWIDKLDLDRLIERKKQIIGEL